MISVSYLDGLVYGVLEVPPSLQSALKAPLRDVAKGLDGTGVTVNVLGFRAELLGPR